jgi:hypothetical protein
MNALRDIHDGFFEGVFASENKAAHLFFRSHNGERSTLVLSGVERLDVSGFRAGNIILDVTLFDSSELKAEQIARLYGLSNPEKVQQLLIQAQDKGLQRLELNPSYGAECTALFRSAEVLSGHVWPIPS